MPDLNDRITVIVRSIGERTERLCYERLKAQIAQANIHIVRQTPFTEALRKTYQTGMEQNRKWTCVVDADLLVMPRIIRKMTAYADGLDDNVFLVMGTIIDKFLKSPRDGGIHLYRTQWFHKAIDLIPDPNKVIRPECHVLNQMKEMNFPFVRTKLITGLHDFEQYYRDIYRKCFVQAKKHYEMVTELLPEWHRKAEKDPDFRVAIAGFNAGAQFSGATAIDANAGYMDGFQTAMQNLGLTEKKPLYAGDFSGSRNPEKQADTFIETRGKDAETRRTRLTFVVDKPGWAHDFKADNIIRCISDEFECRKVFSDYAQDSDIEWADLIVVFYWKQFRNPAMQKLIPAFQKNRRKVLIGVCSHQEMEGALREQGLPILRSLAAGVFFNSRLLYNAHAESVDVPVFYTPNGVDTARFTPRAAKPSSDGVLTVGWAGSLTNNGDCRGYHDIIVPAVNSVQGVRLLTAAREEKWRTLEQMPAFYQQLDAYVCASTAEGTPNPCLEAAASGIPVLTTPVGNMPELIRPGVNGFFFERTAEKLAEKLRLLRDNAALRLRLGSAARQSALEWDWKIQAENYRNMFRAMLKQETSRQGVSTAPAENPHQPARSDCAAAAFDSGSSVKLSVVLTTYNRPELLEKVLSGFAAQSAPRNAFEVIVVDDGSAPPVRAIAEKFSGVISVNYLYQENSGLAAARNAGIRAARGEIVLFSDDDDVPSTDLVAEHLKSHRQHPDQSVAVLGRLDWHPDLQVTPLMHYVTRVGGEYFSFEKLQDGRFYDHWKWWGGLISAKRSLLNEVPGPFDTRFHFGYEDIDLACRLSARNIRILYSAAACSFILRPITFEEYCRRSEKQGKALHRLAAAHPDIILTRYRLDQAMDEYRNHYAATLEEDAARIARFESLLMSMPRHIDKETETMLELLYEGYRECIRGHLLKGYAQQCQAVARGEVSVQDPVNAETPLKAGVVASDTPENAMKPPLKIAVVSVQTPAFDAGSSDLRLHHILRILLSRGRRIDYLYPVAGKSDEKYKSIYNGRIDFRKIEKSEESFAAYMMSKANDEPDAVWITNLWNIDYTAFALDIVRWLRKHRPHIRIIVDTMDFHYKKHMRRFELYRDPQDRDKAEHFLTLEKQLYLLADRVLTVTDVEKQDILAHAAGSRVEVIPNIHDILQNGPDVRLRRHICFVGSFTVWHNRDAVIWFMKDVFPIIRTQTPDVEFHIIGHGNEKYRDVLETYPNVRVIGYVEDAEQTVAQYRLAVCPMTYGAGMKGKIGLAAAAGTPFVTTSIGAEGFDWVDGRDCCIADTPKTFAEHCVRLLRDDVFWEQLRNNARQTMDARFSVSAVSGRIDSLLDSMTAERHPRQTPGQLCPTASGKADAPAVSIIMSCYNEQACLAECLDSILAQTLTEWELLVVDDGSTDRTREILNTYAAKDSRIRLWFFDDRKGPYVRRNFAIEQSRAPFVTIHDADDVMRQDKLDCFYRHISRNPRLAIVGSWYRWFYNDISDPEFGDCMEWPLSHRDILERSFVGADFCVHGSAMIRKTLFEDIGSFDEHPWGSDSFWLRKAGLYSLLTGKVQFENVPECLTYVRGRAGSQTGRINPHDPRCRRRRLSKYFTDKLNEIETAFKKNPDFDLKTSLRECTIADFIQRFGHLFERWENAPVSDEMLDQVASRAAREFENGHYVFTLILLNTLEKMNAGIGEKCTDFHLFKSLSYYAAGHDRPAAEQMARLSQTQRERFHFDFSIADPSERKRRVSDFYKTGYADATALIIDNTMSSSERDALSPSCETDEQYLERIRRQIRDCPSRRSCRDAKPEFSVIMRNYNKALYIAEAIESVLAQTFQNWELIIVDDASTDDSLEIIKKYLNDPRIKLVCHDKNRGISTGVLTGVAHCTGDLFGELDSDDMLTPDAIEKMVRAHREHPECGFIYSQHQFCDEWMNPGNTGFCKALPKQASTLNTDFVGAFRTYKVADYVRTEMHDPDLGIAEDKDIIHKMEEVTSLYFVPEILYKVRLLSWSQCRGDSKTQEGWLLWARAKINAFKRRSRQLAIHHQKKPDEIFRALIDRAYKKDFHVFLLFGIIERYRALLCAETGWTPKTQGAGTDDFVCSLAMDYDIKKLVSILKKHRKLSEPKWTEFMKWLKDSAGHAKKPRVSLTIAAYNSEAFIAETIRSILAQSFRDFELIIVDDGSTDNTVPIIQSFKDSRIRLISQPHQNVGAARNRAIREARGEFQMIVDSDDWIEPDYLQRLWDAAQEYPGYDYYYPEFLTLIDTQGRTADTPWHYRKVENPQALPALLFVNGSSPIPSAGSLKRRTLFERLGLYREIETVEDFEFLARHADRIRFKRVDGVAGYRYRLHQNGISRRMPARNRLTAAILEAMLTRYRPEILWPAMNTTAPEQRQAAFITYILSVFAAHAKRHADRGGRFYEQAAVRIQRRWTKKNLAGRPKTAKKTPVYV